MNNNQNVQMSKYTTIYNHANLYTSCNIKFVLKEILGKRVCNNIIVRVDGLENIKL